METNFTRGFPVGQRPTVGMGGYILGGGFGSLTHMQSLGSDNLVAAEVVTADGNIISVNDKSHSALLWALRGGGGGNVAVVTEFTLRTTDVSRGVVFIKYIFPPNDLVEAADLFGKHFQNLDNRYSVSVIQSMDDPIFENAANLQILTVCASTLDECQAGLKDAGIPSDIISRMSFDHLGFLDAYINGIGWSFPTKYCPTVVRGLPVNCSDVSKVAGLADRDAWPDSGFFKYKTMLMDSDWTMLPEKALQMLTQFYNDGGGVEFQMLGGEMDAVGEAWTAAQNLHRAKSVLILKAPGPMDGLQQNYTEAIQVLSKATAVIFSLSSMQEGPYRAYVNFLDTDIPVFGNYSEAYYGGSLSTLRCIKANYDPDAMFSIPLQYGSYSWPGPSALECTDLIASAEKGSRMMGYLLEKAIERDQVYSELPVPSIMSTSSSTDDNQVRNETSHAYSMRLICSAVISVFSLACFFNL